MASFLLHPTEILILLFILLTFVFSGVEKIVDWKGQIVWLKAHFKDTFL
ncbi:MAG: putative oxidoreductase, partial [Dokdonia sp.]